MRLVQSTIKPKFIPNQLSESDLDPSLVKEGEQMYKAILSLMKSYKKSTNQFKSKKVALVHYFESEWMKAINFS